MRQGTADEVSSAGTQKESAPVVAVRQRVVMQPVLDMQHIADARHVVLRVGVHSHARHAVKHRQPWCNAVSVDDVVT